MNAEKLELVDKQFLISTRIVEIEQVFTEWQQGPDQLPQCSIFDAPYMLKNATEKIAFTSEWQ
jgi:hypothetical protein